MTRRPVAAAMRGFSLIELLVAVAVGLVLTLAVSGVLVRGEGRNRASLAVGDIDQGGAYAAAILDGVLRSAGSGFASRAPETYGCRINARRGGNALLLARAGLAVDAWDLSAVAIAQLAAAAAREGLAVATQVRDVVAEPPPPACYDAITVGYFLDRRIAPAIVTALQPGGLLFYQTFGPERVGDRGPRNPAYRLETGELLRLFAQLRVHLYREDGVAGDPARGLRGEVQFIGARI